MQTISYNSADKTIASSHASTDGSRNKSQAEMTKNGRESGAGGHQRMTQTFIGK